MDGNRGGYCLDVDGQSLQIADVTPFANVQEFNVNFDFVVFDEQNFQRVPNFDQLFVLGQVVVADDLFLSLVDPFDENNLEIGSWVGEAKRHLLGTSLPEQWSSSRRLGEGSSTRLLSTRRILPRSCPSRIRRFLQSRIRSLNDRENKRKLSFNLPDPEISPPPLLVTPPSFEPSDDDEEHPQPS